MIAGYDSDRATKLLPLSMIICSKTKVYRVNEHIFLITDPKPRLWVLVLTCNQCFDQNI